MFFSMFTQRSTINQIVFFFYRFSLHAAYKYLTNSSHVLIKSSYTEKAMIQGCTNGNRSRGRQRQQCFEDISDRTGLKINDAARITQDKTQWCNVLLTANSVGPRPLIITDTTTLGFLSFSLTYCNSCNVIKQQNHSESTNLRQSRSDVHII